MYRLLYVMLLMALCYSCKKTDSSGNNSNTNNNDTSAAITAIGTPIGDPVTKTIGSAGGTITSADGRIELIIPPGSLSNNVNISIQPITNECPTGVGDAYDLTPNGTKFLIPATFKFHYSDDDVDGTNPYLFNMAFQDSLNQWKVNIYKDVDTVEKTVSFDLNHFTHIAVPVLIRIYSPKRDFYENEQSTLKVIKGFTPGISLGGNEGGGDELFFMPSPITVSNASVSGWSVSGGSANGTISGTGNTVIYTAPSSIENERSVYVSARVSEYIRTRNRRGQITYLSGSSVYSMRLKLHPTKLSFGIKVDAEISNTSTVYQDKYRDGATFQIDVDRQNVSISKIVNQAPTVTPASGNSATEKASWIPDGTGITNIKGLVLGYIYDTTLNRKAIGMYFDQSGTVNPSWLITKADNSTFTIQGEAVPGFPAVLLFVAADTTQQIISQYDGISTRTQAIFTITPIR